MNDDPTSELIQLTGLVLMVVGFVLAVAVSVYFLIPAFIGFFLFGIMG